MTKIQFILIGELNRQSTLSKLIRLSPDTHADGQGLFVHIDDKTRRAQLKKHIESSGEPTRRGSFLLPNDLSDNKLWSLRDGDVLIGHQHEPDGSHHTLLNVSHHVPWFFGRFERLIEYVDCDSYSREMGRTRYRYYRQRGYALSYRHLN